MKIPEIWDECKSKEQQDAFIKVLDDLEEKEGHLAIPFDEVLKEFGLTKKDLE